MQLILGNDLLSTKVASSISGYSSDYLSRLARLEKISGIQVGRTWLIDRLSLESFIVSQADRKQELARELARVREEEYRAANAKVQVRSDLLVEAVPSEVVFSEVLTRFATAVKTNVLRGSVPAFATAVIVLTGSAALATSPITLSLINGTQSVLLTAADGTREIAYQRFQAISTNIAESIDSVQRVRSSFAVESSAEIASPVRALALPTLSTYEAPSAMTLNEIAMFKAISSNPLGMIRAIPVLAASQYQSLGEHEYALIMTAMNSYNALIAQAGSSMLALGATTRDIIGMTPRTIVQEEIAIGSEAAAISQNILADYSAGVTTYVEVIPRVPEAVIAILYKTGNVASAVASSALPSTRTIGMRAVAILASNSSLRPLQAAVLSAFSSPHTDSSPQVLK